MKRDMKVEDEHVKPLVGVIQLQVSISELVTGDCDISMPQP